MWQNLKLKIRQILGLIFTFLEVTWEKLIGGLFGLELKQTKVKLDLAADIDMLLMVEKGIRGRICYSIYRYAKANNKCMKDYDENKESSYLQYWDINNLYSWVMLQNLPVNNFAWIKDTSQFNRNFIKNYNEESDKGYFFEVGVRYLEKLRKFHNDLPFLPKRVKTVERAKIL